jgi:hypothetical protein
MKLIMTLLTAQILLVAALSIDADYPGGNIRVEEIQDDTVRLRQDLRDTEGWWFYWSFRARGGADRKMTFEFKDPSPIGTRGPACSVDGGRSWRWLGTDCVKGAAFTYSFPAGADEVRFCFAIPYQEADLNRFLKKNGQSPHMSVETHCRTRKGRTTRRIRAGRIEGEPQHRVLLTARHHACESLASYVLEGILQTVLEESGDGRWLREHVEFLAVPFMDKDGVEDGDQGKNRRPHDHNRDYAGTSIYPSVRALREYVPRWSRGRLRLALDLHCPWIRGTRNEMIYMVGGPDLEIWKEVGKFSGILEKVQKGPLVYRKADNLPFGKEWNTGRNYQGKKSCSRWAGELEGIRFATTIETPYANVRKGEVTAESARAFGADVARAIRRYLEAENS